MGGRQTNRQIQRDRLTARKKARATETERGIDIERKQRDRGEVERGVGWGRGD